MKRTILLLFIPAIFLGCESHNEHFLKVKDNALISTHALQFQLQRPDGFAIAEPATHYPTFNGHPFKVSIAAFVADSEAVIIHAEEVLNQAGVLNYSTLKQEMLSGYEFGVRDMCAELSIEEIEDNHDITYLNTHGFTLQPGIFLKQFLTNSADNNSEYIVSYARTVNTCENLKIDSEFKRDVFNRINSIIDLKKLPNAAMN